MLNERNVFDKYVTAPLNIFYKAMDLKNHKQEKFKSTSKVKTQGWRDGSALKGQAHNQN